VVVYNEPGVGLGPCEKIVVPRGSIKSKETSLSQLPGFHISSILCPSQAVNVSTLAPPLNTWKSPIEMPSNKTVKVAPLQLLPVSCMSSV